MRMRNVRVLTQMTYLSLRGWWHSKVIPHPCQSASETNQRCFPPLFFPCLLHSVFYLSPRRNHPAQRAQERNSVLPRRIFHHLLLIPVRPDLVRHFVLLLVPKLSKGSRRSDQTSRIFARQNRLFSSGRLVGPSRPLHHHFRHVQGMTLKNSPCVQ